MRAGIVRSQKPDPKKRVPSPTRAILIGGGVGAIAAYLGMRFGESFGALIPAVAAVVGGLVARSLAKSASTRAQAQLLESADVGSADKTADSASGDGTVLADPAPDQSDSEGLRVSLFAEPDPGEPDWPVETQEVRLKLDLAKEYLEVDETDLAAELLHEVLELEVATARKLAVEILNEAEEPRFGNANPERNGSA